MSWVIGTLMPCLDTAFRRADCPLGPYTAVSVLNDFVSDRLKRRDLLLVVRCLDVVEQIYVKGSLKNNLSIFFIIQS